MSLPWEALALSSEALLGALLRSSLQGALFIAAVWAVCRLFPRLPATVRCGLWWAASLKLLVGLFWISPVELPLLPASLSPSPATVVAVAAPASPQLVVLPKAAPGREAGERAAEAETLRAAARTALAGLWLAGLLALAVHALRQLLHTRWVVRRSEPLAESWVRAAFMDLCARLSLRRAPRLLGSDDVRTPQAIGLVRPLVVLPRPSLEKLSPPEVSMTLCHELVHLRRGDLWLGWVPALAHRLFFFHPLAAMAAREYAIAREAACDAEVIQILGSAPQAYGRLLLRWGVAPRDTGLAAAGASPSLQTLKRRLQMLQQSTDNKRRVSGWWWLAGAFILAGLVPLRIVAQDQAPKAETAETAEAAEISEAAVAPKAPKPVPAPKPALAPRPVPSPKAVPAPQAVPAPKAVPPAAPATPAPSIPAPRAVPSPLPVPAATPAPAPLPPVRMAMAAPAAAPALAPRADMSRRPAPPAPPAPPPTPPAPPAPPKAKGSYSYSYSHGDSDGDSWMYLRGNGETTMNGNLAELKEVRKLRGSSKEDLLWYRRDGKAYVVRDAAILKRAEAIFKPQTELGEKQGALGGRQGELGGRQGALGAKQATLGTEIAALAAKRAGGADDADFERRTEEISKKMEELGRQQEELGHQQEALGRQQEALGRQQEELTRKVEKELGGLMDQAIASGAAQPVGK